MHRKSPIDITLIGDFHSFIIRLLFISQSFAFNLTHPHNVRHMKPFSLKAVIALLLVTQAASALAYVVKGAVVDATGKPLYKALVLGINKDGTKVIEIETNKLGQFVSAEINDSTLSIEITKDTFVPLQINISGTSSQFVDLGTITLFERQVTLAVTLSFLRKRSWGSRQTDCPCSTLYSIKCQV